jgi:Domain of unknown function (DUF5615)
MSINLYMDVDVRQAIMDGLRLRGVDVLTAQEDGASRLSDTLLLDCAMALGRALFSQDRELLREAPERQQRDMPFAGVIYAHQLKVTVGQEVRDLELLAHTSDPGDFANRAEYLPLR